MLALDFEVFTFCITTASTVFIITVLSFQKVSFTGHKCHLIRNRKPNKSKKKKKKRCCFRFINITVDMTWVNWSAFWNIGEVFCSKIVDWLSALWHFWGHCPCTPTSIWPLWTSSSVVLFLHLQFFLLLWLPLRHCLPFGYLILWFIFNTLLFPPVLLSSTLTFTPPDHSFHCLWIALSNS